ncbi:MAG TPA: hypothetical protein VFB37_17285 [Steroidobacteraceae bacterium]|nr:hypothetical protein [Steroidobacteraceae bacterium]
MQFGILLDRPQLKRWQLNCLQRLLGLPQVQPVCLIQVGGPTTKLSRGPAPSEIPADDGTLEAVLPLPAALEALSGAIPSGLDFVLSFASAPAAAALREQARWGVWRYQFGDWTRLRGGPPGFWEVHYGDPESAVLLVRETPDPDAVVVLREGYVRTLAQSVARNRAQLLSVAVHFAAQMCLDLQNGVVEHMSTATRRSGAPAHGDPTSLQRAICTLRILGRMAAEGYHALFTHTQWNVGIVEQPITAFVNGARPTSVRWLPAPKRNEFRADPFGVLRDGHLTILLEDFSYISNRGTISATQPAAGTTVPVTIGPQPAVHLSYPYLIEVEGRLYCMPEAHEAREVVLYEVKRFPDDWARVARFPIETVIVDATLFRHEDRWWIAGSEPGTKGASSELHLWYAPAIEGPWTAHPGNPVKIDIRSARPAGTPFYRDGQLYRPAQDCSRSYGGRVSINHVLALTPTAFQEVVVATVEPAATGLFREGIHTLSSVGAITLIDGKRTLFVPEEFQRNARHFLRQALRRLGVSSKPAAGVPPVAS